MEVMKLTLLLLFISVTRGAIIKRSEEENCTRLLDVIAVVDGSDSIIDEDFSMLKSALIKLAEWLDLGNKSEKFGAVVFSSSISDKANLSSDIDSLKSQITAFGHPKMGTSTHLGVQEMKKMFEENGRKGVPQVGIVITDGRSINPSATQVAADEAKALGINMISVGIGVGVNMTELSGIATNQGNVKRIQTFDQLEPLLTSLLRNYCIVDGSWSAWSDATEGPCSVSCGKGERSLSYNRTCTNPVPENGGKICQGPSSRMETEVCKLDKCPIDGSWSPWSDATEGPCSVSCGGGVRSLSYNRTCTNPVPKNGGKICQGPSSRVETEVCKLDKCPIDGSWSPWSDATEGPCSVSCGGGVRSLSYNRTCTNPVPKNGGKICQGPSLRVETEVCKLDKCPIDGSWSPWSDATEGPCSVSCGGGVRSLSYNRTCTNPVPKNGGKICQGPSSRVETEVCKLDKCPSGDPCSGCRYHNGVGYMPHPSDCRYFLQCVYGASHSVMPCPGGLYWEQSHLTCTESRDNCTADIPEDDPEQVPTVTWSGTCDGKTRYIAGSSGEYEEDVPNIGWMTRQCGPGTVYNTAICTCVHGNNNVASKCSPQVYLPFSGNVNDESGHNTHVHNAGVDITLSNQASFINDAYLRINRFSNMDFGKTLVITFLMTKGASTAGDQAIVSNAECEEGGSVYIIMRNNGFVEFRVFNKEGTKHSLAVQYTVPSRGLTPVSLVIDEGSMVVRVNNLEKSMPFNGSIGKSHCAVEIGKGTGFDGYMGLVDDFKLYLCKP